MEPLLSREIRQNQKLRVMRYSQKESGGRFRDRRKIRLKADRR